MTLNNRKNEGKKKTTFKERYLTSKREAYYRFCKSENKPVNLKILSKLIEQWKFDYEMEHLHE